MTAPALGELVAVARQLMAWSDIRDRELAARLAAERSAYEAGRAAGDREGREAVHEWYAGMWRDVADELGALALAPAISETDRRRYHVCCRSCRLGGHREGCPRCEDRARETFGLPHPDDRAGLAPAPARARTAA